MASDVRSYLIDSIVSRVITENSRATYRENWTSFKWSIIAHVHNQMAVFTLGHCSNLTRSAWAYQNAEKSERQSWPID